MLCLQQGGSIGTQADKQAASGHVEPDTETSAIASAIVSESARALL